MVERFLRYSLEHGRKITLMVADERGIRRMNVTVTAMDESTVTYTAGRADKPGKRWRGTASFPLPMRGGMRAIP